MMKTIWGEQLQAQSVLQEYPRPQLRRKQYEILNGLWDYAITASEAPPTNWDGQILVPFSPEAALSGVNRTLQPNQYLWYRRPLTQTPKPGHRLLLHFGAVDQEATVYLGGVEVGSHCGGYTAFTLDITAQSQIGNELLVRVRDRSDTVPLTRGKQKTKRGGIWYTPQSGIWQTVWLEEVPEHYIQSLRIVPKFDDSAVEITAVSAVSAPCTLTLGDEIFSGQTNTAIRIPMPLFRPWSPESPYLYDFSVEFGEDHVDSYFAMRKVKVQRDEHGVPRIHLNNRPYFMHGVLDQGYWPDGMYTAPSDEALIFDIQAMKAAGFNTLRKHIKVEPMRWYYHCDRLGMLVWQDMPNGGGDYRLDTISLPLITGVHRKDNRYDRFARQDARGRQQFLSELLEMILQLRDVPSIVLWTVFNEGWGQFDAGKAVSLVRELDSERLIDHASGWHDQGIGSLQSLHVYFKSYRFRPDRRGRAVILSEYGGYNFRIAAHSWNRKNFGYRRYRDSDGLLSAYEALITGQILPAMERGLSAAIYTQLSDVEDEVNGILTYDRKIAKLPTAALRNVNLQLTGWNQRR